MSVTDLFIGGAPRYSEEETRLFDDVMQHLIDHVENTALAALSARLAPIENAPLGTIRRLARNDAVEVAGPVLNQSPRLSDTDLIEIASTKSQAHLTYIARRPRLNFAVTDALVDHGNIDVANEVALNAGAQLSQLTAAKLVLRADGDGRLAESLARRADISPAMFRSLIVQATDAVREKLLASAPPELHDAIRKVLSEISAEIAKPARAQKDYAEARRVVAAFSQDTKLTRMKILEFADAGCVTEMIVALSVLSGVPVAHIERLVEEASGFGLMVLCRSIALDWNTVQSVLIVREGALADSSYDELRAQHAELSVASASKLIHFWSGRQKVSDKFRR
jgi:uncharacterized protein (DUF2336 family)